MGGESRLDNSIECTTNKDPERRSANAKDHTYWDRL